MGIGYATNSGTNLMTHATLKVNNKNGIFWLPQFDPRYGEYLDTSCKRLSFSIVFPFHCCGYFMIYIFFIITYYFFPVFYKSSRFAFSAPLSLISTKEAVAYILTFQPTLMNFLYLSIKFMTTML